MAGALERNICLSMLDQAADIAETDTGLLTLDQARSVAAPGGALHTMLGWLANYPVRPHRDLGRAGVVCPFTRPASKLDTVRVALSACGEEDERRAVRLIHDQLKAMECIPAARGDEHFRTIVTVFPNCTSATGIAMLERAIKRYKYYLLFHLRTMGLLHPASKQEGLWNPDFRPMTAPLPVLVIRHVVEQDARFIADHHLQWGPFVLRYGISGVRRLIQERRRT